MTSRIGSPDTEADLLLRKYLGEQPTLSFVMVSGAGSGKTTSLVKALSHLAQTKGPMLRRRGQQVACITYTEVAVDEIRRDVGNASLFQVSTIHSFLWTVVHSFQNDLREWVAGRIQEKIAEAQARLVNPRTRAGTRSRLTEEIERNREQLRRLATVRKFSYGTGSNYADGVLGHDDILRVGPALIHQYPLLRSIIARRFPYIFVDESQDTNPSVVEALKSVAEAPEHNCCLGFFGDPMQKIYTVGVGPITHGEGWNEITKPENFRCPATVLNVINKIRAEGDGIVQIPGRRVGPNGPAELPQGTARLFIARTGNDRPARLAEVRRWLAVTNGDALWESDEEQGDVRLLVLVHRSAARQLGFADLYAALNDNGSTSLKDGLLEGTAWVLRPFMSYLLPLVLAARTKDDFEVISTLRKNSPPLQKDRLAGRDVASVLERLKGDVNAIVELFEPHSSHSIRDVLTFVRDRQIADLDERFLPFLTEGNPEDAPVANEQDLASVLAFLNTPATQLWGYRRYIESQSAFSTHQGIKGAEFQRVLVVLDDEESDYSLFSYGKYLGIEPLSDRDRENIASGADSVLDRTRRLFYVCCSRALQDLAVLLFTPNVEVARNAIAAKGIFTTEDIHVLQ